MTNGFWLACWFLLPPGIFGCLLGHPYKHPFGEHFGDQFELLDAPCHSTRSVPWIAYTTGSLEPGWAPTPYCHAAAKRFVVNISGMTHKAPLYAYVGMLQDMAPEFPPKVDTGMVRGIFEGLMFPALQISRYGAFGTWLLQSFCATALTFSAFGLWGFCHPKHFM